MGKAPNYNFIGRVKVSCDLERSQLPSAQNSSHAKVAHLGEVCSETRQP